MRKNGIPAAMLLAAIAAPAFGGAEVVHRTITPLPTAPRTSGYRMGRRSRAVPRKGNPAGTKLARQAARGLLTISRIR